MIDRSGWLREQLLDPSTKYIMHHTSIIKYEQLDFAESVGWLAPGDRAVVKEGTSESESKIDTTATHSAAAASATNTAIVFMTQ